MQLALKSTGCCIKLQAARAAPWRRCWRRHPHGPSSGGHGTLAGELLVEDDAQVDHLVLMGLWTWAYDGMEPKALSKSYYYYSYYCHYYYYYYYHYYYYY